MSSNVLDVITTRRSVRDFKAGAVPDADVKRILEAGRMAPSPGNSQPWRFHVLQGVTKSRFVEMLKTSDAVPTRWRALVVLGMSTVPVVVAIENTLVNSPVRNGSAGSCKGGAPAGLSLDSIDVSSAGSLLGTAAAVENMLLAIHALGYGSVWLGFPPILAAVKDVIAAPGEIVAVLPVGHPADVQNDYMNRARKPIEQLARFYQ